MYSLYLQMWNWSKIGEMPGLLVITKNLLQSWLGSWFSDSISLLCIVWDPHITEFVGENHIYFRFYIMIVSQERQLNSRHPVIHAFYCAWLSKNLPFPNSCIFNIHHIFNSMSYTDGGKKSLSEKKMGKGNKVLCGHFCWYLSPGNISFQFPWTRK